MQKSATDDIAATADDIRSRRKFVLSQEGGFVDDPVDPGGRTKYGISQKAYPDLNIEYLTTEQAIAIYRRDYWEQLPALVSDGLAFLLFDCAVNVGNDRAIKLLQRAIGAAPDGFFGPVSRKSLAKYEPREAMIRFQAERARHYALLDDLDDTYARGWMNRTMRAFAHAIEGEI